MTRDKKEYAEMLGLMDRSDDPRIDQDRQLALRYLLSGATIPQTLLTRIERINMAAKSA